eukprot:86876_1
MHITKANKEVDGIDLGLYRTRLEATRGSVGDEDELHAETQRLCSLHTIQENICDANCFGLSECARYGLKGTMGYWHHAELLHGTAPDGTYSVEERDEIFQTIFETINDLA